MLSDCSWKNGGNYDHRQLPPMNSNSVFLKTVWSFLVGARQAEVFIGLGRASGDDDGRLLAGEAWYPPLYVSTNFLLPGTPFRPTRVTMPYPAGQLRRIETQRVLPLHLARYLLRYPKNVSLVFKRRSLAEV